MSEAVIYRDSAGEWRFRIVGDNGEILLASEGYVSKSNAERGLETALAEMAEIHDASEGGEAA